MDISRTLLAVSFAVVCLISLVACQSGEPLQAAAGSDTAIKVGERPTFDGCDSTGNIVNYKWTIITPCENMPEDAGKVIRESMPACSFTLEAPVEADAFGTWVIELEVRDAGRNTSTDTVRIEVTS